MRLTRYTHPHPAACSPTPPTQGAAWRPPVDVLSAAEHYLLRLDLPGIDEKAVEVQLEDGLLSVSGERTEAAVEPDVQPTIRERRRGKFRREFRLPEAVDADAITARFERGVLEIRVPKIDRSRRIPIQ